MSSMLRLAARTAVRSTRQFASSSVARKDLVQDMYVRELKSYKPVTAAKDAHVGAVKQYSTPSAPKPPSVPADLAAELSAYDAADPTRAPINADAATGEHSGQSPEEFLELLEADEVDHKAHH